VNGALAPQTNPRFDLAPTSHAAAWGDRGGKVVRGDVKMRSKVEVRAGLAGLHLPTHVHERSFLLQKKERVVLGPPLLIFVTLVLVMHNADDLCVLI